MAAGALVHCVAPFPRLSSSSNRHSQAPALSCAPSSSSSLASCNVWGIIKLRTASPPPLNRCSAAGEVDESFTTNGNVELFDDRAGELEDFISNTKDKLVVLDISTKTCGPCKVVYPKLVKMSIEYPDAAFLKINGDHDSETRALMRKWKIRAVPSFRFFRNGELIHSHSGAKEDELRAHFLVHYMKTLQEVK